MKRACHAHPKLYDLADALGISRTHAVGILETLWHLTGTQQPHGDIGSLSDRQIARALDWPDPARIVRALIETGWLDEHPEYRLVVHNWHLHCDDAVRKAVLRSGRPFASLSEDLSGKVETCPDKKRLPQPQPQPQPQPSPLPPADAGGPDPGEASVGRVREPMPAIPPELDSPAFLAAWDDWLAYRRELRKDPYRRRGLAACWAGLIADFGNGDVAAAAIRHSMAKGWQGIFGAKSGPGPPSKSSDFTALVADAFAAPLPEKRR